MTLTQLNAFVLVARLGSVTAAANALGVSEPAVSQALSALRQHLGDQLLTRGPAGMTLTAGGSRLLASASQIVVLGAEAHAAVRAAQGAPEQLRVVATSTVAEFVIGPLMEAFTRRFPGSVEVSVGVAVTKEMGVLVANRLADVAISPSVPDDPALAVVIEPIFRYRVVVVTARQSGLRGNPRQWRWLVDPSGTDPGTAAGQLLDRLRIPENKIRVFPNQTAARRRRPTAGAWHRPSSTWSPSSCAGASSPWWTRPACRWTPAGTSPRWSASSAAPRSARSGASWARQRPCISCAHRARACHHPASGHLYT
jgi:LysR family transcriptional regulator, low CO2-responsive transcriptional regulator